MSVNWDFEVFWSVIHKKGSRNISVFGWGVLTGVAAQKSLFKMKLNLQTISCSSRSLNPYTPTIYWVSLRVNSFCDTAWRASVLCAPKAILESLLSIRKQVWSLKWHAVSLWITVSQLTTFASSLTPNRGDWNSFLPLLKVNRTEVKLLMFFLVPISIFESKPPSIASSVA